MWAVLLLSFAMYPLGFLFGACSDCCEECPEECSKCGRAYSGSDGGNPPCEDISGNWALQVGASNVTYGTVAGGNITFLGFPIFDSSVSLPFSCRNVEDTATFSFSLIATIQNNFEIVRENDRCGCQCCLLTPGVSLRISAVSGIVSGPDRNFLSGIDTVTLGAQLCDCSEDTVAATLQLSLDLAGFDGLFSDRMAAPCADLFAEWFSQQTLSVVFSDIVPCECGACCGNDGSCEVSPEFYCDTDNRNNFYSFDGLQMEWQGVGTTCDPNPCPQPGACCDGGECSQTLEEDCGGVFQGEGTTCDPNPC